MAKPADDLEAIRLVIQALEPFDSKDRERIIRWAEEKLGMSAAPAITSSGPIATSASARTTLNTTSALAPAASAAQKDLRSFVTAKSPKSDNQLAAVVAYFYHFEAPPELRKDSIGKDELIDACRQSGRNRPARPAQVLVNTFHAGLLDRSGEAGK